MSLFRTGIAVAIALGGNAIGATTIRAQSTRDGLLAELKTDSVAWQRVLAYVVSVLGPQIVQTSVDPSPQPWDLRLPTAEPQRRLLESQLRTILRARPVAETDTVRYTLELGSLRIVNDTAHVEVRIDVGHRCPGTNYFAGGGSVSDVVVPRHPVLKVWGAASSARGMVGDRAGCRP